MEVPPALARHRREVDDFLRAHLDRRGAPLLYEMARYHLGWEDEQGNPTDARGKGVRSGLCLLACEASGGDWQKAVPAAAAVELVHAFSLVHDDVQDRDRERHHRPAVWTVWGEAQAINAGDALLALARLALSEPPEPGNSAKSVVSAGRTLDEATLDMVEGQTLDIEFESRESVSLDDYFGMIRRKTGALFACALELAALSAGAPARAREDFRRLGLALGMAFQLRDDVLAVWGDPAKTGKPAIGDILRGKKSLPVVMAAAAATGGTVNELSTAYQRGDVGAVVSAFDALGVRRLCEEQVAGKTAEALAQLDGFEFKPEQRAEMKDVVRFLLEREF